MNKAKKFDGLFCSPDCGYLEGGRDIVPTCSFYELNVCGLSSALFRCEECLNDKKGLTSEE